MTSPSPFLGTVYGILLVVLGAGLVSLMGLASVWLARKAKESSLARLAAHAFDLAQSVVAHIESEMRPKLTSALADGRLTPEERLELKEQAMRLLKEALAEKGLAQLEKVRGLTGSATQVYLSGLVERALGAQKAVGKLAALAESARPQTPR